MSPAARPERTADVRPLRSLEALPNNNLPAQLTTFVGRARELAELARALTQKRLLTLTGAGGCGKSRLALEAAGEAMDSFDDGVWWVELAPLSDPELLAAAVAHVFGVRPLPGQTELDAVVSYLASRRALVVLDNCEHVLEESARVAEALVRGCPGVVVVATSRQPLRVAGETDWRVPSLSLPPESGNRGPSLSERSDAVRLFAERASNVRADFGLTDDNAAAVARVCRELDGIPLAIELAAARLRMLSAEQIADALADRFRLLTGGPHTALPRHRTLHASVDWSHSLLTDREQMLFRRLAVFIGGFTLEAAHHVCAFDDIAPDDAFDLLSSLVEKSLVQAEERGSVVRYRLLETVRQYALGRLEAAGEAERTRHRHRDDFLELAERIASELLTPRQPELLAILEPEAANLAQAIQWAANTDPDKALRLCVALTFWWRLRSYFALGDAALRQAIEAATSELGALRARALWGRAYLLTYAGAFEAAIPAANEALAEAERADDDSTMARALLVIGTLTMFPDPAGSRPMLERARELAIASGDEFALLLATANLAYSFSHQNDHIRARSLFEELLPLAARLGNQEAMAWYWIGAGWADWAAGWEGLRQWTDDDLSRALAAARAIGDVVTEASATLGEGLRFIDAGDPELALESLVAIHERALSHGGAFTLHWVEWVIALAHAAAGRLDEARAVLDGVIERAAGGIASVLTAAHADVAEVLRLLGESHAAENAARRGLELADQLGDRLSGAGTRLALGRAAAKRGEWAEAQRFHHEALSAIMEGAYRRELPRALEALGEVAAGLESYTEAARILGAASRARENFGVAAWKHQRDEIEALHARVREAIGAEGFAEAFSEGEALSPAEAVAYVRRARGERKRPSSGWEALTPTELKVVRHTAAGLTNPEIAERMFISRGTVKSHLSTIYSKLGLKNRSELAVEAAHRNPPES